MQSKLSWKDTLFIIDIDQCLSCEYLILFASMSDMFIRHNSNNIKGLLELFYYIAYSDSKTIFNPILQQIIVKSMKAKYKFCIWSHNEIALTQEQLYLDLIHNMIYLMMIDDENQTKLDFPKFIQQLEQKRKFYGKHYKINISSNFLILNQLDAKGYKEPSDLRDDNLANFFNGKFLVLLDDNIPDNVHKNTKLTYFPIYHFLKDKTHKALVNKVIDNLIKHRFVRDDDDELIIQIQQTFSSAFIRNENDNQKADILLQSYDLNQEFYNFIADLEGNSLGIQD